MSDKSLEKLRDRFKAFKSATNQIQWDRHNLSVTVHFNNTQETILFIGMHVPKRYMHKITLQGVNSDNQPINKTFEQVSDITWEVQ